MKPAVTSRDFHHALKGHGFNFFTGVPCSLIDKLLRMLELDPDVSYVPAIKEDIAVGVAVGAYLAGSKPVVFIQNSALGVCINPLSSLAILYKIPLLLIVTWRGYQGADSEEHQLTGEITPILLQAMGLPYLLLGKRSINADLAFARKTLNASKLPIAVILHKGVLD